MLVYAGIDEAGYGPMLGPLCVASAAFVVEAEAGAGAPDLWRRLDAAVCRERRDPRRRIAVDDSKKLKGGSASTRVHPLKHLERAVLAFSAVAEDAPGPVAGDDDALLERLGARIAGHPWYGSRSALPLGQTPDAARIDAGRLRRALGGAGVRCAMVHCEAIDADDLNRGVERMGTKASVNLGAALRGVDRIWRAFAASHPRVIVDRQGGRTHYREELQAAWPDARIRIVAESEQVCRYRLERDLAGAAGSRLTVSFVAESEARHLPVALASMTAKYVRELHMLRMNRYFQGHLPELRETAGYFTDARRYLGEIEPVIRKLDLARRSLVRVV